MRRLLTAWGRPTAMRSSHSVALPGGKIKRIRYPIDGFIAAGETAAAFEALNTMPKKDVRASHVAAVLHMTERDGREDLTRDILESTVKPNAHLWEENICSVWLRHQCNRGEFLGAWGTAMFIASKGGDQWKRRNLSPLLAAACRAQQRAHVMELLHHAQRCSVVLDVDDVDTLVTYFESIREPLTTLHHLLAMVVDYLPSIKPRTVPTIQRWCSASGLAVPAVTSVEPAGVCGNCGVKLHGLPFTNDHKKRALEGIRSAAGVTRRRDPAYEARRRRSFEAWTKLVESYAPLRTADVIVDGANVGYYGLSSWYHIVKAEMVKHCTEHFPDRLARLHKGTTWSKKLPFVDVPVSMELIDEAMSEVKAAGMRPVLFLHERHVEPHNLFPKARDLLQKWRASSEVVTTPGGLNDDVCWLHAAITLCSPTDAADTNGRRDVLVLTNDAMRDHHFQLLHQSSFAAWRGRHQMKFSCVREDGHTRVRLEPPASFTQCVQHNVERRAWHLPVLEALNPPGPLSLGDTDDEVDDPPEGSSGESVPLASWLCIH